MIRWTLGTLFGLGLCLSIAAQADSSPNLKLIDQYASGPALYLILENISDHALQLSPKGLHSRDTGFAPPIWWAQAAPSTLTPGTRGCVRLAMRRAGALAGDYQIDFGGYVLDVDLHIEEVPQPLAVAQVLHVPSMHQVALFLRNNGNESVAIEGLSIAGVDAPLNVASGFSEILPCDTGVVFATYNSPTNAEVAEPAVLCEIRTNRGTFYRSAFLMKAPQIAVRTGEIPGAYICPTHRHGPWNKVATELFAIKPGPDALLPEVHFCRNRLPEGLGALGQCLPRAIVNPQGSNKERGTLNAWAGLHDIAALAKSSTEPGIFSAMIESGSNFEGSFGQAQSVEVEAMSPRELRHTAYLALAEGAKGLVFRFDDKTPLAFRQFASELAEELGAIAPWLLTMEPISLHATATAPDASVATLYCGPEALLVVCMRESVNPDEAASQVTVEFDAPKWFSPKVALEVGGTWREEELKQSGPVVSLSYPQMDGIAVTLLRSEK